MARGDQLGRQWKIIRSLIASKRGKSVQDLASEHNVRQQRFRQEHEDCILCGLCVRMCEEQMMAKAIAAPSPSMAPMKT